MSARTTDAPSSASLSAIARPMPCALPVTIATRPSSFMVRAPPVPGCSGVELGGVLPGLPSPHVMRREDLRVVFLRPLLDALEGADRLDGVQVEAADDHPVEGLVGVR